MIALSEDSAVPVKRRIELLRVIQLLFLLLAKASPINENPRDDDMARDTSKVTLIEKQVG